MAPHLKNTLRAFVEKGLHFPKNKGKLQIQKVADKSMENALKGEVFKENWNDFYSRVLETEYSNLRTSDLGRLILEIWEHAELSQKASKVIQEGQSRDRKTLDMNFILSYLLRFPENHLAFNELANAAKIGAERIGGDWGRRQSEYKLFSPEDKEMRLAKALIASDEPKEIMDDAGLIGPLAAGAFFTNAIKETCIFAGKSVGQNVELIGRKIIKLFGSLPASGANDKYLAFALLGPFINQDQKVSPKYQNEISQILVSKIGDPRIQAARWSVVASELEQLNFGANVSELPNILRRWLVQTTVKEFFRIIARTTERPDQWRDRQYFWEQYLEAGKISDACFVLGNSASNYARMYKGDAPLSFSTHDANGADSEKSSLLMVIGNMVIAEWSDNSTCKFWRSTCKSAPTLHRKFYSAATIKSTYKLKNEFETLPHAGSLQSWGKRFAGIVYQWSGNNRYRHPIFGSGEYYG